jgi:hypothetical protein
MLPEAEMRGPAAGCAVAPVAEWRLAASKPPLLPLLLVRARLDAQAGSSRRCCKARMLLLLLLRDVLGVCQPMTPLLLVPHAPNNASS